MCVVRALRVNIKKLNGADLNFKFFDFDCLLTAPANGPHVVQRFFNMRDFSKSRT